MQWYKRMSKGLLPCPNSFPVNEIPPLPHCKWKSWDSGSAVSPAVQGMALHYWLIWHLCTVYLSDSSWHTRLEEVLNGGCPPPPQGQSGTGPRRIPLFASFRAWLESCRLKASSFLTVQLHKRRHQSTLEGRKSLHNYSPSLGSSFMLPKKCCPWTLLAYNKTTKNSGSLHTGKLLTGFRCCLELRFCWINQNSHIMASHKFWFCGNTIPYTLRKNWVSDIVALIDV